MNYRILYAEDIFSNEKCDSDHTFSDELCSIVAKNRNLPADWCKKVFTLQDVPLCADLLNVTDAIDLLSSHIEKGNKIQIVVDCDVDGYCSAAITYKLCKAMACLNVNAQSKNKFIEIVFSIHSGKQHGLSSDIKIDKDTNLVILPDSGSNDVLQCLDLNERGIDVLILDHHVMEANNPYATIVNCMDSTYPNEICGTAVVWQFARAISYYICYSSINVFEWLDLVAIATVADSMNVTIPENMYYVQNGLNCIYLDILIEFFRANEVAIDSVTIEDVKFKIAPYINSVIRMGSMEEKTLLLRAFIGDFEVFDYSKRGSFEVTKETIYERAVRLCKNAKSRQDREKKKCIDSFSKNPRLIKESQYLIIADCSNAHPNITGLVANELASSKLKPCICVRLADAIDSPGKYFTPYYIGSIRNYAGSPIGSFKNVLESTELFDFVQGHDNSAGFKINTYNLGKLEFEFEEILDNDIKANMGSKFIDVDFKIPIEDIDVALCKKFSEFDNYTGYGFPEVTVFIADIPVGVGNFAVMGKNSLSWKIKINENVSVVKFKLSYEDELLVAMDNIEFDCRPSRYYIDAICTLKLNNYNGIISAQCIVKDYELKQIDYAIDDFEDNDDIDDIDFGV